MGRDIRLPHDRDIRRNLVATILASGLAIEVPVVYLKIHLADRTCCICRTPPPRGREFPRRCFRNCSRRGRRSYPYQAIGTWSWNVQSL